jgi:S-adenosylmethionine:tRNA ribosyltransferase-isomerase
VNANPDGTWDALIRPSKRVHLGTVIAFSDGLTASAEARHEALHRIRFNIESPALYQYLEEHGSPPVPPYIKPTDPRTLRDDYQTIYARHDGAIAAPTAGFHFTPRVFAALSESGIGHTFVTLHVGLGTFQPVREDHIEEHRMHAEFFTFPSQAATLINDAKSAGERIVAVGTTSTRVLESCAADGHVASTEGSTDLFITPGWHFGIVDALITNFHLPESTLLMLVCAFAGRDLILKAYEEAIRREYRFYSFGDAMLIE